MLRIPKKGSLEKIVLRDFYNEKAKTFEPKEGAEDEESPEHHKCIELAEKCGEATLHVKNLGRAEVNAFELAFTAIQEEEKARLIAARKVNTRESAPELWDESRSLIWTLEGKKAVYELSKKAVLKFVGEFSGVEAEGMDLKNPEQIVEALEFAGLLMDMLEPIMKKQGCSKEEVFS